jgi:polysaccharide biosynthesis protein PelF
MAKYLRKSENIDVMIFAEGTYPYVRGGVSSWIAQLIGGIENIRFGICFIGSQESDYKGVQYELPKNLVHLEVHYIFSDENAKKVKPRHGNKKAFESIHALHESFKKKHLEFPKDMQRIDFYTKDVLFEDFLYSKMAWNFVDEQYEKNCPDISFIDYFWTLRNIHRPIWVLADIVKKLPQAKCFYAPSTGYAGFAGALASNNYKIPFFLTEHGIYTKERKIDMLTAEWIKYQKSNLLKQPEEFSYIKQMWVNFFQRIGEFAYQHSELIISLYPGAQKMQISLGADETKTKVIPNGVDVDGLSAVMKNTKRDAGSIITLIGRVVSIKDIKTFIRAMKMTVATIPDAEGWIVGPTEEDPEYYKECVHMVESLGLQEHVKFLGFQNIKEILPKSNLLTLTSISEGMPLVTLEGFATGLPCIATNVGSCEDLICGGLDEEDIALGHAGAVTAIAAPTQLAKEYIRFLSDQTLWQKASLAALRRVQRYYRQDELLHTYNTIFQEIMQEND